MKIGSLVLRTVVGLVFAFWMMNVLAVAVFAVPDRYSGVQGLIMSLLIFAGGLLPVAVFAYLFRDSLGAIIPGPAPVTPGLRTNGPGHVAGDKPVLVEPLSVRELEVLSLIERGRLNKEIAQELSVSLGTVKTHTNNINRKLGARSRMQAVAIARRLELL